MTGYTIRGWDEHKYYMDNTNHQGYYLEATRAGLRLPSAKNFQNYYAYKYNEHKPYKWAVFNGREWRWRPIPRALLRTPTGLSNDEQFFHVKEAMGNAIISRIDARNRNRIANLQRKQQPARVLMDFKPHRVKHQNR